MKISRPYLWWNTLRAKKVLAIALLVSIGLHFLFISQSTWELLFNEEASHEVLHARLIVQHAAKLPAKVEQALPDPPTAQPKPTKKTKATKPSSAPSPKPELSPKLEETATLAPPMADPAPSVQRVTPLAESTVVAEQALVEPPAYIPTEMPVDPALVGAPYQQVVTDFDVFLNGANHRSGRSVIIFKQEDNQQYNLKWQVEVTGLLALFYPNLIQTSIGKITEAGLQPVRYEYLFGDKKNKSYSANFDWSSHTVNLHSHKGDKTFALDINTQDLLSFLYQFMYVPPLDDMQVKLTNGRNINAYDYDFVGEELIKVKDQELKAIRIAHSNALDDEKSELWLALDYRYIPIKIKKVDKSGRVIEQVATHISAQ